MKKQDPIAAEMVRIQREIEILVSRNQKLGREIDERRNARREINDKVRALQGQFNLCIAMSKDPEVAEMAKKLAVDADAPGAVVEVKASDLFAEMAKASKARGN